MRSQRFRYSIVLACMMSYGVGHAQFSGTLTGLGYSNPVSNTGKSFSISPDGKYVAGYEQAGFNPTRATLWSSATGMVNLGQINNDPSTEAVAYSSSANGSVVAGLSQDRVFRWTSSTGMVNIGYLPGGSFARGGYVSRDGNVIVGQGNSFNSTFNEAFYYTTSGGLVGIGAFAGVPAGSYTSIAKAVSADGSVIAGSAITPAGIFNQYRWTSATGMVSLGTIPGSASFQGDPWGMSGSGNHIVGDARDSDTGLNTAYRWTSSQGMIRLGELSPGFMSRALAVTDDGKVVVGLAGTSSGSRAFIWDEAHGMRLLQTALQNEYGVTIPAGWNYFIDAYGIAGSLDSQLYITGSGLNPQGKTESWIVTISSVPEPATWAMIGLFSTSLGVYLVCRMRHRHQLLDQEIQTS
ncbi:MAG: hypothetical protein QM703_29020 [Gemmatales bacterium]